MYTKQEIEKALKIRKALMRPCNYEKYNFRRNGDILFKWYSNISVEQLSGLYGLSKRRITQIIEQTEKIVKHNIK